VAVAVKLQTTLCPYKNSHLTQVKTLAHETEVVRQAFTGITCELVLAIALAAAQFVAL